MRQAKGRNRAEPRVKRDGRWSGQQQQQQQHPVILFTETMRGEKVGSRILPLLLNLKTVRGEEGTRGSILPMTLFLRSGDEMKGRKQHLSFDLDPKDREKRGWGDEGSIFSLTVPGSGERRGG